MTHGDRLFLLAPLQSRIPRCHRHLPRSPPRRVNHPPSQSPRRQRRDHKIPPRTPQIRKERGLRLLPTRKYPPRRKNRTRSRHRAPKAQFLSLLTTLKIRRNRKDDFHSEENICSNSERL